MTSNKMKILFIGTVRFSYQTFLELLKNEFNIVGLITKQKSDFNADFYDLKPIAEEFNIPVIFRKKDNEEDLIKFIEDKKPDVIYCFGWSYLLPMKILTIPPYGVIGFHPAKLPNNRGRHPIIWALFLGLKKTASTFFIMNEEADAGDIISQEDIIIEDNDSAETLYVKITNTALKQILRFSKDLEKNKGKISRTEQSLNDGNFWRKRTKNDGKIDFRMSTKAIINLVRALTHPYVGAHIEYLENDVKVWNAEEGEESFAEIDNYEPGKVLDVSGDNIIVKTYDGTIKITQHEFITKPNIGDYL